MAGSVHEPLTGAAHESAQDGDEVAWAAPAPAVTLSRPVARTARPARNDRIVLCLPMTDPPAFWCCCGPMPGNPDANLRATGPRRNVESHTHWRLRTSVFRRRTPAAGRWPDCGLSRYTDGAISSSATHRATPAG